MRLHPEILPVTAEGVTLWHGSRRHYCPHSPAYHEYATRLVRALAERYRDHPALALWHPDNEYASHVTECFCDSSAQAFRTWLQKRYGSLEGLNRAWGTAFWSQHYGHWDEIHPPRKAPTFINPSQLLDWARFNSDSWIACFDEQKTILRELTPNVPVSTNFMGFHKPADYWKFAAQEDIVSNDNYPDTYDPEWMIGAGMVCDLMRSLGERRPWILMEQAPTHVNWRQRNATKRPGVMRLCSYQAIARGADGVMFFQWRASKAGAEKHHSGMLPHAGTDSRVWREVKAFGAELPRLAQLLSSRVQAQVAFLFDWENWWALELKGKPSNDLRLMSLVRGYYASFFKRNITLDFVHPEADLSRYRLVVAPNLYLVNERAAENINRYVAEGGTLAMSFFSGIVDENEQIQLGSYPAPFREMLGLGVEEYVPYGESEANTFRTFSGQEFRCSLWSDVIQLQSAETLARYTQDYYAEKAAITRNKFGQGSAFYIGTFPETGGLDWLVGQLCEKANVQPVEERAPVGVELLRRSNGQQTWLFALNHAKERVTLPLAESGRDLLTGAQVSNSIVLDPLGVAIVEIAAQEATPPQ